MGILRPRFAADYRTLLWLAMATANLVTIWFVPAGDKYFLGKADFGKGVNLVSLSDTDGKGKKVLGGVGNFFSFAMQYLPDGFLQMIFIDTNGFDKQHYHFDYVKREFLGEVRCLVFDVTPLPKSGKGRFLGRIWVEDQDYHIVRFNGGYGGAGKTTYYFHFDSWRTNLQPGVWLPSFVYSEEKELHYAMTKKLDFRAQTRLWGYNIGKAQQGRPHRPVRVSRASALLWLPLACFPGG